MTSKSVWFLFTLRAVLIYADSAHSQQFIVADSRRDPSTPRQCNSHSNVSNNEELVELDYTQTQYFRGFCVLASRAKYCDGKYKRLAKVCKRYRHFRQHY